MTVEIIIKDDEGKEVVRHTADPFQPTQYRWPADNPLIQKEARPGDASVVLSLFMFTYAPVVTRELRNGGR